MHINVAAHTQALNNERMYVCNDSYSRIGYTTKVALYFEVDLHDHLLLNLGGFLQR